MSLLFSFLGSFTNPQLMPDLKERLNFMSHKAHSKMAFSFHSKGNTDRTHQMHLTWKFRAESTQVEGPALETKEGTDKCDYIIRETMTKASTNLKHKHWIRTAHIYCIYIQSQALTNHKPKRRYGQLMEELSMNTQ